MFSGFQPNAYQVNAYQIVLVNQEPVRAAGGKVDNSNNNSYERSKADYYERQRLEADKAKASEDLKAKDQEIDALEAKRLAKLDDYRMQRELMALMRERQDLLDQQASLERMLFFYRNQQNAIIALLLSNPF